MYSSFKTNAMRKIIYLFFTVAFMFTCRNAFTQTSVVMKALDGTTKLNGGSTVAGHTNEIDVLSNSHGETFCIGCAKPNFSSFNIMISLSPATISFKKLLLNGTKLTSVDVTYIKTAIPLEYYKIHMENVTVESVQESASSEIPTFSVSLTPDRMAWQQISDTNKKTSYGWDIAANIEWLYY
jgi:type VI protein secretion system component Hcp